MMNALLLLAALAFGGSASSGDATVASTQTWTGTNTHAGTDNFTGTVQSGGAATVTSTCSTDQYLATATTARGLVTGGTCTTPGLVFISSTVTTVDVTTITFTLPSSSIGARYRLQFAATSAKTGTTTLDLFVNNDTTKTNYTGLFYGTGSGSLSEPLMSQTTSLACDMSGNVEMWVDLSGFWRYTVQDSRRHTCGPTAMRFYEYHVSKTGTIATFDRLDIIANQSDGIEAGATVYLYRYLP